MILTHHQKESIMENFPFVELSYVKNIHKKVHSSNLYYIIPKGKKFFVWFHQYNSNFVCFMMELEGQKKIKDIKMQLGCFKSDLCVGKGTILYGTEFKSKGRFFFAIEDIFYYKGQQVAMFSQFNKINILKRILQFELKSVELKDSWIYGLPLMDINYNRILNNFHNTAYEPLCIQHRILHKSDFYVNQYLENKNYAIFNIRPLLQTDIYQLYCRGKNDTERYHGLAHIPNFKTSVMMNSLFRNIKENKNLDLLEESDDEDDFQNINPDKYVFLDRTYNMRCVYNYKRKRWLPLKKTFEKTLTHIKDIAQLEK